MLLQYKRGADNQDVLVYLKKKFEKTRSITNFIKLESKAQTLSAYSFF
jgi:hypothetical protein